MGSIVSAAFARLHVCEIQPRCYVSPGVSIHYLYTLLLMDIQLLSSLGLLPWCFSVKFLSMSLGVNLVLELELVGCMYILI